MEGFKEKIIQKKPETEINFWDVGKLLYPNKKLKKGVLGGFYAPKVGNPRNIIKICWLIP